MSAADPAAAVEWSNGGAPPRHIDLTTALLDRYARGWIDLQQTRKVISQRELPESIIEDFARGERRLSALLTRTLREHALWPWLSQFPGLGGAHTALVIGRIGDPRRYPGQRCSEGHYLPPVYTVGAPCPIAEGRAAIDGENGDGAGFPRADETRSEIDSTTVCPGVMLPPRDATGVRSLWHWAGLHVLDSGRAPRKTKGQRADWEPRVRASVMQPGGISEQIVRLTVPHYADVYRDAKARLTLRVVDATREIDAFNGDAEPLRAADVSPEIDFSGGRPLRPFEADRIARKIAAKAFLGDLLTTWKGLA